MSFCRDSKDWTRDRFVGKHPIPSCRFVVTVVFMEAVEQRACYLAEWYLPELTEQSVDDLVARVDDAAAAATGEGTPVELLLTLAVPADEVLYGVFGADSPATVSRTCRAAGAPHQRLSADIGTRIRPPSA
jgi:hypothetical protein